MNWSAFLYRRLSRWVTCELGVASGRLRLATKHEVASFQDVFCSPFYWQVFTALSSAPALVVDCGAHCGHFAGIVEACVQARFGRSDAHYLLIEPNPGLQPILRRNLVDLGLDGRFELVQGAVGTDGQPRLWFDDRNLLSASTSRPGAARHSRPVPAVSLAALVGGRQVDVLKIDVEGAEYRVVEESAEVLRRTGLLLIELHSPVAADDDAIVTRIREAGLSPISRPVANGPHRLLAFHNPALNRSTQPG